MKTKNDIIADDKARRLVEQFLDGTTSCDEEQQLYEYFSSGSLPCDLSPYRDMFAWYADGLKQPVTSQPQHAFTGMLRQITRWQWASIAAMLALLVTMCVNFIIDQRNGQSEYYAAYEGSYIIRNGVKITDLAVVIPELRATKLYIKDEIDAIRNNVDNNDDVWHSQEYYNNHNML